MTHRHTEDGIVFLNGGGDRASREVKKAASPQPPQTARSPVRRGSGDGGGDAIGRRVGSCCGAAVWKVESHTAAEEEESILRCGVCMLSVYSALCSMCVTQREHTKGTKYRKLRESVVLGQTGKVASPM